MVPVPIFIHFLQFGDVFLELIDVEVFPVESIVPLMKGDTMIPNTSGDMNPADKVVILFGLINFELKGFQVSFLA